MLSRSARTKTRRIDLTGQRFGRWLVLAYAGKRSDAVLWSCRCACGSEKKVLAKSLRHGTSKSCGCFCVDLARKTAGYASQTQVYNDYRSNSAKRRGLIWKIPRLVFNQLTQQVCHYCGTVPANVVKAKYRNGNFVYNGLDRKDSSMGYTPDNVVPCCKVCQRAKMDMPYNAFLVYLERVRSFNGPVSY